MYPKKVPGRVYGGMGHDDNCTEPYLSGWMTEGQGSNRHNQNVPKRVADGEGRGRDGTGVEGLQKDTKLSNLRGCQGA
eukprot:364869-Chlamydomonas_euryale.AAC.5